MAVLGWVLFGAGIVLTVGSITSRVRNRRARHQRFVDAVWGPTGSAAVRLQYVGWVLLLISGAILKSHLN